MPTRRLNRFAGRSMRTSTGSRFMLMLTGGFTTCARNSSRRGHRRDARRPRASRPAARIGRQAPLGRGSGEGPLDLQRCCPSRCLNSTLFRVVRGWIPRTSQASRRRAGRPPRSTRRWCLLSGLPLSVSFGPTAAPPFSRARSGLSRLARVQSIGSAARSSGSMS